MNKEHLTKNIAKDKVGDIDDPNSEESKKIVVSSEAWPEGIRPQYCVSSVHKLFLENPDLQISQSEVTFKQVGYEYVDQVKELHQEW